MAKIAFTIRVFVTIRSNFNITSVWSISSKDCQIGLVMADCKILILVLQVLRLLGQWENKWAGVSIVLPSWRWFPSNWSETSKHKVMLTFNESQSRTIIVTVSVKVKRIKAISRAPINKIESVLYETFNFAYPLTDKVLFFKPNFKCLLWQLIKETSYLWYLLWNIVYWILYTEPLE